MDIKIYFKFIVQFSYRFYYLITSEYQFDKPKWNSFVYYNGTPIIILYICSKI